MARAATGDVDEEGVAQYLGVARCPTHGYYAITLDDKDGRGTRLTPGKCCGRWDNIERWKLDTQTIDRIITELESARERLGRA